MLVNFNILIDYIDKVPQKMLTKFHKMFPGILKNDLRYSKDELTEELAYNIKKNKAKFQFK